MKRIIVYAAFLGVVLASCNSSKTQTAINDKKVEEKAVPVNAGSATEGSEIEGTWELVSIINNNGGVSFNEIYPDKKPTISFEGRSKVASGTTSCNSYTCSYSVDNKVISFGTGMSMTKMACPGNGESLFIERIYKANKYFIKDQSTLMLMDGDVALLEFKKILGPKSY